VLVCVELSVFGVFFLASQCVYFDASLEFHFSVCVVIFLQTEKAVRRLRPKKRSILQGEILLLSNLLLSYKNKF
jgi:hypothetical protein